MGRIVVIAEKRDQAAQIASAMGWQSSGGHFSGQLNGQTVRMSWARGHLLTLAPPDEVRPELDWRSDANLIPLPMQFRMKVIPARRGERGGAKQRLEAIAACAQGADLAVLATDADREGEAIGWHILQSIGFKGTVQRAWLAAGLDKKSIKDAFSSLRSGGRTKSWMRASEARSRADWLHQFIVRAITHRARRGAYGEALAGGKGAASVVSVGRVQTPALAMIVRRELEIENFVEQDHWKPHLDAMPGPFRAGYVPMLDKSRLGEPMEGVSWQEGDGAPKPLFVREDLVKAFADRVMAARKAVVAGRRESVSKSKPPKPYALTDAQAAIGKACRINASLAQTILEDLYEQGCLSYPRTSSNLIPLNLYEADERNALFDGVAVHPEFQSLARKAQGIHNGQDADVRPFQPHAFTKKPLEHYALIPTAKPMSAQDFAALQPRKADKGSVRHTADMMRTAWRMVVKRFLLQFLPDAEYDVVQLDLDVACLGLVGEARSRFKAGSRILVKPGWRAWLAQDEETDGDEAAEAAALPPLQIGDSADIADVGMVKARTKPPPRYTETTFPKAMASVGKDVQDPNLRAKLKGCDGIGTPATRKSIVETLLARQYISVTKGSYRPQPKGMDLMSVAPKRLTEPEMTALWEGFLIQLCEVSEDDAKCVRMRDGFVNKQAELITKEISKVLETPAPEPVARPPSEKQLAYATRLARGAELPAEVLASAAACKQYIDQLLESAPLPPSEKQLQYALQLADGEEVPEEVRTDAKACSAFIDAVMKKRGPTPPSEKQLQYAISLAPDGKVPDKVRANGRECSAYIDKMRRGGSRKAAGQSRKSSYGSDSPPSDKQKGFAQRLAPGGKPPAAALKSAAACSAYIEKMLAQGSRPA